MRKSKEEYQAEFDYVVRTLFLRKDLGNLLSILKKKRAKKAMSLLSLRTLDLENLSCTLPSKRNFEIRSF